MYVTAPILQCTEITPHAAYMHSSQDRQSDIYVHEVLLGRSRRKLQQGMGKELHRSAIFLQENQAST